MTKVSEAEMSAAGLSDEEMAALEESETEETNDAPEESAAPEKTDGGSASDDSGDGDVPQTPEAESKGAAADPTPEAEAESPPEAEAGAEASESEDEEAYAPPLAPDSFAAQLAGRGIPEDYEERLAATNDAIEALDKQLEEGELDYAAHAKQNRELTAQLSELSAMRREAEFVAGNNEMIQEQHWQWEVDRFVEEHDEFNHPVVYGALRGALEELYQDEDNIGQSYRWYLRQAASSVRDAFGLDAPSVPADEGDAAQEADRQDAIEQQREATPQAPPPQTLGGVPEAAQEAPVDDEFAQIDRLEGMDLEAALAKMPQSKVDKYLNSRNY